MPKQKNKRVFFSDCETCPLKLKRENFKKECRAFLDEWMEKDAPDDLDALIESVARIASLSNSIEGIADDWDLTTAHLVGIWRSEKNTERRFDDWQNRD